MFTYVVSKAAVPCKEFKDVFVRTVKAYNIKEAVDQVIDPYYMDDIAVNLCDMDTSAVIHYFDKTENYQRYSMMIQEIHESKFYDVLKKG